MRRVYQRSPGRGLSAEQALFLALEDPQTACFLKTTFTIPEEKPEIVTERWMTRDKRCYSWQVAIIEKPLPGLRANLPLLNIAHIMINALDGKVLQRWFLQSVFYEEYTEFMSNVFSLHEGCRGRNP
jgi:hypothetical protein